MMYFAMPAEVPTVAEQSVSKPSSQEKREVKKIKDKMMKEDRLLCANIDHPTPELLEALKALGNAHPALKVCNDKDFKNNFLEFIAQRQYMGLYMALKPPAVPKPKLLRIIRPKLVQEAKLEQVIDAQPNQVLIPQLKELKEAKSKEVKEAKPKLVKLFNPKLLKLLKPSKPIKSQETHDELYQRYLTLTDQQLAAEFLLNQYTWPKYNDLRQEGETWCTLCVKKFQDRSRLAIHLTSIHKI